MYSIYKNVCKICIKQICTKNIAKVSVLSDNGFWGKHYQKEQIKLLYISKIVSGTADNTMAPNIYAPNNKALKYINLKTET